MSSQEIADLVQSRHDNVKIAIERLAQRGVIPFPAMQEKPETGGRPGSVYQLGKRDTYVVVAQLSPEFTGRLVDRWQELETGIAASAIPLPSPHEVAVAVLGANLSAAALLIVPLHYAQIEAVKAARAATGVDYSPLLAYAPAQNDIRPDELMLEPTELALRLGLPSGAVLNQRLYELGLQTRPDGKTWEPTAIGAALCCRHSWTRAGKSGYNLKWNLQSLRALTAAA
jgi:hypothetical protein